MQFNKDNKTLVIFNTDSIYELTFHYLCEKKTSISKKPYLEKPADDATGLTISWSPESEKKTGIFTGLIKYIRHKCNEKENRNNIDIRKGLGQLLLFQFEIDAIDELAIQEFRAIRNKFAEQSMITSLPEDFKFPKLIDYENNAKDLLVILMADFIKASGLVPAQEGKESVGSRLGRKGSVVLSRVASTAGSAIQNSPFRTRQDKKEESGDEAPHSGRSKSTSKQRDKAPHRRKLSIDHLSPPVLETSTHANEDVADETKPLLQKPPRLSRQASDSSISSSLSAASIAPQSSFHGPAATAESKPPARYPSQPRKLQNNYEVRYSPAENTVYVSTSAPHIIAKIRMHFYRNIPITDIPQSLRFEGTHCFNDNISFKYSDWEQHKELMIRRLAFELPDLAKDIQAAYDKTMPAKKSSALTENSASGEAEPADKPEIEKSSRCCGCF